MGGHGGLPIGGRDDDLEAAGTCRSRADRELVARDRYVTERHRRIIEQGRVGVISRRQRGQLRPCETGMTIPGPQLPIRADEIPVVAEAVGYAAQPFLVLVKIRVQSGRVDMQVQTLVLLVSD